MSIYTANWDLVAAATEGGFETHTAGFWDISFLFGALWHIISTKTFVFPVGIKVFFLHICPQNSSSLSFHFLKVPHSLRLTNRPNKSTCRRISANPDLAQITCSVFVFLLTPNWTLLLCVHSQTGAIIPTLSLCHRILAENVHSITML